MIALLFFSKDILHVRKRGTQPEFTCLKFTIKTPEYVSNMFKVNNKDTKTTLLASFWWLLLALNIFHTYSSVSIVNFEHVIASWEVAFWLSFHCYPWAQNYQKN